MAAHLDVAIAGIDRFQFDHVGTFEQVLVLVRGDDLAGDDGVFRGQRRGVLAGADGVEDRDQFGALGEAGLDADQRDHLHHAGHHVVSAEQPPGEVADLRVWHVAARGGEHFVADQRDRLRAAEPDPERAVAAGKFGRGEDRQPVQFRGRQVHGLPRGAVAID